MTDIIYEDADFAAINKPAGISSIPERDLAVPCALSLLEAQLGQKMFMVHRLDKGVSGALLFAKTAQAHRAINALFERRAVSKTYRALVHGILESDSGEINLPLRQFGSGRTGVDMEHGKPSLTRYELLERLKFHTLLDIRTITGRRHQIRAHLYAIGHPIAGHLRYGDRTQQSRYPRLLLHSREIVFELKPGAPIKIAAPLPEGFTQSVARIETEF